MSKTATKDDGHQMEFCRKMSPPKTHNQAQQTDVSYTYKIRWNAILCTMVVYISIEIHVGPNCGPRWVHLAQLLKIQNMRSAKRRKLAIFRHTIYTNNPLLKIMSQAGDERQTEEP